MTFLNHILGTFFTAHVNSSSAPPKNCPLPKVSICYAIAQPMPCESRSNCPGMLGDPPKDKVSKANAQSRLSFELHLVFEILWSKLQQCVKWETWRVSAI